MWKCSLMIGMAFDGRDEPIVLLMTMSMPMATINAFRAEEKLYGFSGSPSSQDITFLCPVTLDTLELGNDCGLLSASSRLYLSVAS